MNRCCGARQKRDGKLGINAKALSVGTRAAADGGDMHKRIRKIRTLVLVFVAIGDFYLVREDFTRIVAECQMYAATPR